MAAGSPQSEDEAASPTSQASHAVVVLSDGALSNNEVKKSCAKGTPPGMNTRENRSERIPARDRSAADG